MKNLFSGAVEKWYCRLTEEYECLPQVVVCNGVVGFNICAQEVCRVWERDDKGIEVEVNYNGRMMPVFG